jgi:SOS-response transcriptional repressor LexA
MIEHERQDNGPVTNGWLRNHLDVSSSGVSNITRRLEDKGYIRRDNGIYFLREEARILMTASHATVPCDLPILGKVTAGRGGTPDVQMTQSQALSDATRRIGIPGVQVGSDAFILEVEGESMRHEGILPGDYVIIQRFDRERAETPSEKELIVAYYLPQYDQKILESQVEFGDDFDEFLEGPTLKYYSRQPNPNGEIIRLSWLRPNDDSNPYTINTRYIRPIGRVIGVYRNIQPNRPRVKT